MIYRKNLPNWERVARMLGALMLAVVAYHLGRTPMGYLLGVSVLVPVVTGLFGYCPVCQIGGRKPLQNT